MGTWFQTATAPSARGPAAGLRGQRSPRFVRVRTDMVAVLMDPARRGAIRGRVDNLSIGGMFFRGADAPRVGTRLECALIWEGAGYRNEFHANGTVVHRRHGGVGIAFEGVTPLGFNVLSDVVPDAAGFRTQAVPRRGPEVPERTRRTGAPAVLTSASRRAA